ncbi:MAG TPA: class I SAM-dependent methyltransferase [Chthonomonadaceae bacterium]|nr:class I SAM-dependent methyltransferase [Chthonomonadaceae bacterium]
MSETAAIANLQSQSADHYFTNDRANMLAYLPAQTHALLDVGCSAGGFGALVKRERGAEVWGIEYQPAVAETAKARLDRVFAGDVAEILPTLPDAYFDCVTFNDVLEHLVNPYQVLLDTARLLKPGGYIVCSIPNLRYYKVMIELLFKKDFQYRDFGVLDKTHLRFFTQKSIRRMFEDLGYAVERLEGINGTRAPLFFLFNALFLGGLSDMRYLQFACVVRRK